MHNVSPYLVLFLMCCAGPVVIFVVGVWLGKNGMPFEIRARRRKGHPATTRYAE